MNTIEFNQVWKKFRKGEKFNSLRDSIPNFFRENVLKIKKSGELEDKEFWAVKDVSFTIKRGEVVGFIGPNGAGKSTILKLLSRIIIPNKGSMNIYGRLSALIEVTAGFHPELTGRENVYLNGTILGMKRAELDQKFNDIVEFSGLKEFIDTPVKRYSSGMFSRLGFSVAAHVNPDVLLVDEVLAVGDIAFQSRCAQKMRELLKSGTTIMLVSHNLQLVQSLCERVILLNRGEIIQEGTPDAVIPYYEELVFSQQQEEFKQSVGKQDYKVKVKVDEPIKLPELFLNGSQSRDSEAISCGSPLKITVEYAARERIEKPVFSIEVLRADGVLCCSSYSKDSEQFSMDSIEGSGAVEINFQSMNLLPGIYLARVSVWDQDLLHPYVIRSLDFFKVSSHHLNKRHDGVFLPDISWMKK